MDSPESAARDYAGRGWCPVPVPLGKKGPRIKSWTQLRITAEQVGQYFDGPGNVGVLLGAPSRNLIDVDLDCTEACRAAQDLLPATSAIFGRPSKPASHWLYVTKLAPAKFLDPSDKSTLLEIRSNGQQTLFPGSVHPSGEAISWQASGDPWNVAPDELLDAVCKLAAASLLAKYWPAAGGRHDAHLTLAACLTRAGWEVAQVAAFCACVARAAGGTAEPDKRMATAQDAADRFRNSRTLRGMPKLEELVGDAIACGVARWLNFRGKWQSVVSKRSVAASPVVAPPGLRHNSDVEIARHVRGLLERRHGEIVSAEGAIWCHEAPCWRQLSGSEVRRLVQDLDGQLVGGNPLRLDRRRIDSVLHELDVMVARPDFFEEPAVGINCSSGFIAFDDDGLPALEPHSSRHRVRHVIRGRWPTNPTESIVRASLLSRLLRGTFLYDRDAEAKIDLLGEAFASAALGMSTSLKQPCAIVLYGPTAENGKSQFLDLMRAFLPKDVVSAIPPQRFSDEKHLVKLAGCLLNASDELSSAAAITADIFKLVITGEPVNGRDVYRSVLNFRPRAQHVFATNVLPPISGGLDRGVRRRLLVVTFNRVIPLGERIPHMGRLVAEREPDLVLDWVVQSARRLTVSKNFTCPLSSIEAAREWFLGADPVLAWLEEAIDLDPQAPRVPTGEAHRHFKAWASHEGFADGRLPAVSAFAQRVVAASIGIRTTRTGGRRYLCGLRLRGQPASVRAAASG